MSRIVKYIIILVIGGILAVDIAAYNFINRNGDKAFQRYLRHLKNYAVQIVDFQFNAPEFIPPIRFETSEQQKIPKIIHYVWFGSKILPQDAQNTIETWRKYAPDYEIKRWDERNCDVTENEFIRYAYEHKMYDYASDWCRFKALEQEGGLYLDTDHVLTKPLKLPDSELVVVRENIFGISASFIGVIPHYPLIQELLRPENWHSYDTVGFGSSPAKLTGAVQAYFDWQKLSLSGFYSPKITIYPANFYMFDYGGGENRAMHFYGSGGTEYSTNSPWYQFYYNDNLARIFYPVDDFIILPQENGEAYDYKTKQKFYLRTTKDNVVWLQDKNHKSLGYYYCSLGFCSRIISWR